MPSTRSKKSTQPPAKSTARRTTKKEPEEAPTAVKPKSQRDLLQESRTWTADEEKSLKKYFSLYQESEDVFYLISAMVSNTSAEEIALHLMHQGLVSREKLFNNFPHLENNDAISDVREEEAIPPLISKIVSTLSNPGTAITWVVAKMEEAAFTREFSHFSVGGEEDVKSVKTKKKTSHSTTFPSYLVVPLNQQETDFISNRWMRKLFTALHWAEDAQSGLWQIPIELSSSQIRCYIDMLSPVKVKLLEVEEKKMKESEKEAEMKRAREDRKLQTAERIKKNVKEELAKREAYFAAEEEKEKENKQKNRQGPAVSTVSSSFAAQKRTFKKSPVKPLASNGSTDELDSIFASPVYKKPKAKPAPLKIAPVFPSFT